MRLDVKLIKNYTRNFFTSNSTAILEQLKHRSLIRVCGSDSVNLLQALVTNDMQHLGHNMESMYSMFLNNKGRVLYDTIVYRLPVENTYMLEVDKEVIDAVRKHLIVYRLRKKVDIVSVGDELNIWVYFNPNVIHEETLPSSSVKETISDRVIVKKVNGNEILTFHDPRLSALGLRILAPLSSQTDLLKLFPGKRESKYRQFRYQLGVGEGIKELPPGNCFPLEANCDYLHGVSFHKGCYIGQELTARTHHTGVIRKRLMPLLFENSFSTEPAQDEVIKSGETNIGKLRGYDNETGLGLLRIQQALDAKQIIINNSIARTFKPNWWPVEAKKGKLTKTL